MISSTIEIRKDMIEDKWSNTPQKVKIKKTGEVVSGFTDGHGHFDVFVDVHTFIRYCLSEVELQ